MGKRVVVVASGETERRALPHLLVNLKEQELVVMEVRIPPRNLPLTPQMGARLIKAAWYTNLHDTPDKFVVLLDTDRDDPAIVLREFQERLPNRLQNIDADLLYACAQRHLEAWYFGDPARLRAFLGRNLGSVDTSQPDQIENPKQHLKQLLGHRVYTARVSEQIARELSPDAIAERSPSFAGLVDAVANGQP